MNIENIGIVGHLEIEEVCRETGRVELVVDERNVIVTTGFQTFLGGISSADQYQFGFDGIYLGRDVGAGTLESPEPANKFTTSADQEVVHRVDDNSVWHSFPAHNKLRFTSVVDGHDIFLNTGEPRNVFTSASIRNKRNEVVAYKRFAGRVTSPMLSLNIRWTLTVVDQCIDIPTRLVTDVVFYVMKEWEEQPNTDILHPEELTMGTGSYTREVLLGDDEREVFVIALQEWDNGTITAIEWDNGVPISPNTNATLDTATATYTQVSPYVMQVRMKTDKIENIMKICSEGVCDQLAVRNTTIYPQTWSGLIPIGGTAESEWPDSRFWKIKTLSGALYGSDAINQSTDPNQDVWQYYVDGNGIVLRNTETDQTETRITDGRIDHVHVGFDNNLRPIIVWQTDHDMYINSWKEDSVSYVTETFSNCIAPHVVCPSSNPNLGEVVDPVVVYVNKINGNLMSRTLTPTPIETIVDTHAIDILSSGVTPYGNHKVIYAKRVSGVPVITNVATNRLGGYGGSGLINTTLTGTIHQVGLTNNNLIIGE